MPLDRRRSLTTEDQLEQLDAGPRKTNLEAVADPRQSPTMPMRPISRWSP